MECIDVSVPTADKKREASSMKALFEQAGSIDEKMIVPESQWKRLRAKQIGSVDYDQDLWFRNMADAKPSLFHDFPVPALSSGESKRSHWPMQPND